MAIYREIHTTFYTDKAANIIKAALKIVGEGTFYTGRRSRRTALYAIINKHPNGEVLVSFDDNTISRWNLVSYVRDNNDINARKWLAWQIKDVVQHELSLNGDTKHEGWNRNSQMPVKSLSYNSNCPVTVQEAYCIYDLLNSRKNTNRRYSEELIASLCGTENDPFKTEMEIQYRNEVKLITDEYAKKIKEADINSYYTEIRKRMEAEMTEVRKRYSEESKKLMAELTTERNNKLKEINDQFSMLAAI